MKKVKVAVVGATGYTGEELVRLLSGHPQAEISYVSGKEDRQRKIQEIFPYLKGKVDLPCRAFSFEQAARDSEIVFLSLPHTVSMECAPLFLKAGRRVIDISADYRLKNLAVHEKYYKVKHKDSENLRTAVYGLPELYREQIKKAALVANPGCYPTGAILALLPGVREGWLDAGSLIVDAKSGVTGAGRKAEKSLNFSEVNESFKAYKLFEHQHLPEIEDHLSFAAGKALNVVFVPHLLPVNRGILSTVYARLSKKGADTQSLLALYRDFYHKEPFVNVLPEGELPEIKHAAYSNFCHIGLKVDTQKNLAVIVSVIDNLGKGAAGQAVQNMNLMAGFDERAGL